MLQNCKLHCLKQSFESKQRTNLGICSMSSAVFTYLNFLKKKKNYRLPNHFRHKSACYKLDKYVFLGIFLKRLLLVGMLGSMLNIIIHGFLNYVTLLLAINKTPILIIQLVFFVRWQKVTYRFNSFMTAAVII